MHLMTLEQLETWVGKAAIEAARNAMDLQSISHFEFDKRGRLQAGVKPAPPSTEKPSYVKVTVRGNRTVVDCRVHGKGKWCLHAIILCLHHLGVSPSYQVREKTPTEKARKPRLGFRLEIQVDAQGAEFFLRSRATGQKINQPLAYLQKNPGIFKWSEQTHSALMSVAEDQGPSFWIERADLAVALNALFGSEIFFGQSEQTLEWRTSSLALGRVKVAIAGDRLDWEANPALPKDCIYAPGRPGFTISGPEAYRRAYVPDFQGFGSGSRGSVPWTPEFLSGLLNEKHLLDWDPKPPVRLTDLPSPGIRLKVDRRSLLGEAGFWEGDRFLALNDWQHAIQWLADRNGGLLLHTHPGAIARFRKGMKAVRAPWQDGRFHIREQAAPTFLEGLRLAPEMRLDRTEADRWFGLTPLEVETEWDETADLPKYRIGGELFRHGELLQGAMGESGLRLQDGRVLNIDFGEILTNDRVVKGVAALHQSTEARRSLLRRIRGEAESREPTTPLNDHWVQILRDYQLEGVRWLLNRIEQDEPALLADDMGLGKTVQSLALLDAIRGDKPQLIVVPRSLLENWAESCQAFCGHRNVTIHHGSSRADRPERLADKDLVITTYGTVLRDADMLYEVAFQVVVLDEAQAIKNPQAQTSQAIFDLWADHRIALTGTPIENRLLELWSIFEFLASGYLGEQDEVRHLPGPGTPTFESFRRKVKPFLLRRLKGEVAKELPPKQELVLRVPLTNEQKQAYRQVLHGARDAFKSAKPTTMGILTKLLRLRQICCHMGLVDEANVRARSAKFELLMDHLEEIIASGHSVLIFSQFTQLLGLLKFELEERDWDYLYLDGQTRDRQKLVHRFQDGEAPLFLISLKAGGTGLNLTKAEYVFHLDPWWNPMVMTQATDRAHRIGQTQTVFSYKIIAADTIEEDILKMQASKKFLAEGVWQDADTVLEGLDRETLLGLLG